MKKRAIAKAGATYLLLFLLTLFGVIACEANTEPDPQAIKMKTPSSSEPKDESNDGSEASAHDVLIIIYHDEKKMKSDQALVAEFGVKRERSFLNLRMDIVRILPGKDKNDVIKRLKNDTNISSVEENSTLHIQKKENEAF